MTKDAPQKYVAVFRTDYSLHLKAKHGDFAERAAQTMKEAGLKREVRIFDTIQEEYPSDEELKRNIQAIWITGSAFDAYSDIPWINTLEDYIKRITTMFPQIPLVGICFGHQMIAKAFGAKVGRNHKGWEYGAHHIKINNDDEDVREAFGHFGETFKIQEVHQDVVLQLPEGLKSIGCTENTQHQGFYKKNHIVSFQGHPELHSQYMFDLLQHMKGKHEEFTKEFITAGEERALSSHHGLELTKVILKHMESRQEIDW